MKKTRFHYLLLSFLIAMTSWQCNGTASDQSNNAVTTSDPVEKEVVTDKNRIALRVRVDNLRMRSGPGMDAEVIEKLPENTRLTDLGEASKEMAEVMLRGVKHKAPWMKVRTSSGKEGWVFGGAVTPVQAGTSSTAGEAAPFSAYLKKLKQRNCTNLAAAKAALIKRLKANPGTQDSDESIAAFHKFYEETVEKANGFEPMGKDEQAFALLVYNPDKKPLPKHVAAKAKEWKACGIALEYPEGMLYLVESPDYMVQNFAHLASPPMKKYLLQRQIELKEGFSEDAGLLITPQKLAERLAFWDQFQLSFPHFIYESAITYQHKFNMAVMMRGLDNTPAFDWSEANRLEPKWKSAYEWLMNTHPNTVSGKKIKEYYTLLKRNNFSGKSKEVNDYTAKIWDF